MRALAHVGVPGHRAQHADLRARLMRVAVEVGGDQAGGREHVVAQEQDEGRRRGACTDVTAPRPVPGAR